MTPATFFEHFHTPAGTPNAVAKMRELILQFAVQGKLVPQDPNDEPVTAVCEEQQRPRGSSAHCKVDRRNGSHKVADQLALYRVPEGWRWIRLGDCGDFIGGGTPSKRRAEFWKGDLPWVSPKDMKRPYITDSIDHISPTALEASSARLVPSGSLLMVVRGMILAHSFPVALSTRELTINQDMKALRLAIPEFGEYLLLCCTALKSRMLENVERSSHGTCRLAMDAVANFRVPLPPLAEQRRIVAKVDELMKLCDELEKQEQRQRETRQRLSAASLDRLLAARDPDEFAAHWQRVCDHFDLLYDSPETVEQLRQAILQLAVRGKLTRRDRLGVVPELPLGSLLREDSLNGCSKAPQNGPPGVEILRISAGTSRCDGIVDEGDHKWVDLSDQELEKFRLLPGDLLACRFNGNLHFVGRFSLYLGTSRRIQVNPDKLIRFRLDVAKTDPRYVRYAMNSHDTRAKIEVFCATTAGNIGISATNLKSVTLPVPTLDEQRAIVARVDHLLSLCDGLVSRLCRSRLDGKKLLAAAVQMCSAND